MARPGSICAWTVRHRLQLDVRVLVAPWSIQIEQAPTDGHQPAMQPRMLFDIGFRIKPAADGQNRKVAFCAFVWGYDFKQIVTNIAPAAFVFKVPDTKVDCVKSADA
jgi:hypothetical protein